MKHKIHNFVRYAAYAMISLLLGLLLFPGALDFAISKLPIFSNLEKSSLENAKKLYTHFDSFQNDWKILNPHLAAITLPQEKDAGPFLNPKSLWEVSKQDPESTLALESFQKAFPNNTPIALLDSKTKEEIKNTNFRSQKIPSHLQIDTAWIHKLREFDHWDVDKNSPSTFMPDKTTLSTINPSISYPNHLLHLRVHLLRARTKDKIAYAEALKDVLHYGYLAATNESIIANHILASTMNLAAEALESEPLLKNHVEHAWLVLIHERERYKRFAMATTQFGSPRMGSDLEKLKLVLSQKTGLSGVCGAVRESFFMGPDWWALKTQIDPNLFQEYAKLIAPNLIPCRLSWMQRDFTDFALTEKRLLRLTKTSKESISLANDEFGNFQYKMTMFIIGNPQMKNLRRITATFMDFTNPDFTRLYERNIASESKSKDI